MSLWMKKKLLDRKGSFYEYTILIIVIIGAIILMQPYIFRGIMGRWKSIGDTFGFGRQYDPGSTVVTENIGDGNDDDGNGGGGPGGGPGGGVPPAF